MLKEAALFIALLGIGILLILLNGSAREISGFSEINESLDNEKVLLSGEVIEERVYSFGRVLKLDSEIEVECDCKGFLGKNVSIEGFVDDFTGEKMVRVLKIGEK